MDSATRASLRLPRPRGHVRGAIGIPKKVRALGLQDLSGAAKIVVHPGNLTWVVVGDRSKIEAGIRELNLGEIRFIDSDGNAVN